MAVPISNRLRQFTPGEWAFAALLGTAFSIAFSIALGQAFAGLCVALFLVAVWRGEIRLRIPAVMVWGVLFILWAMALSGWMGGGHEWWKRTSRLFWFLLIPITATLVGAPGRDHKVLWAFFSGCAVLGMKDLLGNPVLAWWKPGAPDYLTSLIDKGSMTDGQMLMLGVVGCFLILLMAIKQGRRVPWWLWMLLIAQSAGLIINFKRGSWFCAILLMGLCILIQLKWRAWLLAWVVLVVFFALPPVQTRMGELRKEWNTEGGGRLTMWAKIAPVLIHEHPAGVGYGCLTNDMMRKVFPRVEPNRNHLHANWAQVLVETGWLGIGLYLVWMLRSLADGAAWVRRVTNRAVEERAAAWVALLLLSGLLLNGLVEYNFGDTEMIFIYALVMGLAGAKRQGP